MKRILALLLAAVCLLSLCACGKKKDAAAGSGENSDVFGPPNPNLEVNITLNNLYDYFEYKEFPSYSQDENGTVNAVEISYGLALREGYTAINDPDKPDTMEITFIADGVVNKGAYEVNFQTLEYSGVTESTQVEQIQENLGFWPQGNRTFTWEFGIYNKSYINYLQNFQVIRAQGTVHLRKEF